MPLLKEISDELLNLIEIDARALASILFDDVMCSVPPKPMLSSYGDDPE
jgi:hypothetical protein